MKSSKHGGPPWWGVAFTPTKRKKTMKTKKTMQTMKIMDKRKRKKILSLVQENKFL